MNIDETCALLDEQNAYSTFLVRSLRAMYGTTPFVIERKGRDLVEVVQRLKKQKLYPIVDKGLRLIFGLRGAQHDYPRAELFRYHYHAGDPRLELSSVKGIEAQDRYISEGCGYFISSMRPDIIIAGRRYRPDSFDKDLFLMHHVEFFEG